MITVIIIAILVVSGIGATVFLDIGRSDSNNPLAGEIRIDAKGRKVAIPDNLDNGIVTIGGNGPLRFLSIFDVNDKLIQVDESDVKDKGGKAYSYTYPYDEFPPDMYHPWNKLETETVERIGKKSPSLIIVQESVYNNYKDNCDILAKSYTLIVLHEQSDVNLWKDDFTLSDWYVSNIRLIGDMIGKPERAEEHISDVNGIIADIRGLISNSDIKTYVAGLTNKGSNELITTFPSYLPLMLVDGENAYKGTESGRADLEVEKITSDIMPNTGMIVIDPSSSDKLTTVNSQKVMEYIYGLSENERPPIYITLPMISYMANYDCVLAGSYYMAHLLYGTISLEEVEEKIVDVFQAYYGDAGINVYEDMKEFFRNETSKNGQEMPLLGEVKIELNGGKYRFITA